MEELKTAALSICAALVSLGLISILLPQNGNKKTISAVFGVCTVLAVVLPLSGGLKLNPSKTAEVPFANSSGLTQTAQDQFLDLTELQLKTVAESALSAAGNKDAKISVSMDISESGSIFIECVTADITHPEDAQSVVDVLIASIGVEPGRVEVKSNG